MLDLLTRSLALAVLLSLVNAKATPPYPQWPLPPSAPLMNMGRRGMPPASEFGLFYNICALQPSWFDFDVSDIPFRQDVLLISAGAAPTYPRQGPHKIETYPGGRAAFYAQLDIELTGIIHLWVPMSDYDGLLIYDYEYFDAYWTGHHNVHSDLGPDAIDDDPIDDWRDALRVTRAVQLAGMTPDQQEAYFKQEWLSTTREFFTHCYNLAKQLRPNSKVSFYNQPTQDYWWWRNAHLAADMRTGYEQEAQWFWDMVDVICPSVYPCYMSMPTGQNSNPWEDTQADFDMYLRDNIGEAIRVSNGKPVYPYVSFQYHPSNQLYANQIVNDYNLRRPYEIAREMGCQGVIMWSWFTTQEQFNTAQDFFRQTFSPFLRDFSQLPAMPRQTSCTPDLGTQGGVWGTDGVIDDNDFISFIQLFFSNNHRADLGKQGGVAGYDGLLNNNDFIAFVDSFFTGCN